MTANILDERTANGTDGATRVYKNSVVYCDGTFDGATVTVEFAPKSDGPWNTNSDLTFTAKGQTATVFTEQTWVRATVSSAGASTSVSVWAN